jgi:hypothetical protein
MQYKLTKTPLSNLHNHTHNYYNRPLYTPHLNYNLDNNDGSINPQALQHNGSRSAQQVTQALVVMGSENEPMKLVFDDDV